MDPFQIKLVNKIKPKDAPKAAAADTPQQSVKLSFVFSDGLFGTEEEQTMLSELRGEIEAAITAMNCGTLTVDDPDLVELGKAIYMIKGEDADLIWAAIADLLEKRTFSPGSVATKTYADRTEDVDLTALA